MTELKINDQTQPLHKTSVMQSVIFPNELRLGNKILDKNDKQIVVTGITDITLYSDEHFKSGQLIEWCRGIRLSEEIISEICLNENKVMGMYRLNATDDYCISFSLDNDLIYIGDDIEIRISETPLHRFQNIFHSLTGRKSLFLAALHLVQ